MADAFDTASQDIENQRRQAVAALAANGSAGAAALAQANSQIASMRQAALNGALAQAASRGVPTGAAAELQGIIGRPYDLLAGSTAQMAASQAQRQAALGQSNENYYHQIAAAVPVAKQALQTNIAQSVAKANAAAAAAAAKAAQANQLSDSELRTRLMGAGESLQQDALGNASHLHHVTQQSYMGLKSQLGALEKTIAQRKANAKTKGPHPVTQNMEKVATALEKQVMAARGNRNAATRGVQDITNTPTQIYARKAGLGAGEDQNLVNGLLPIPKSTQAKVKPESLIAPVTDAARRAGIKPKALARIIKPSGPNATNSTWFEIASRQAQAAVKSGIPLDTFRKDLELHVPKKLKRTKALVLAIYGPAFGK